MTSNETSQQWIARLSGDNREQRDTAVAELRELLFGRLERAFRNRPDVSSGQLDDILQDALVKVLDKLNQFEGRSQFTTWATTIAIRTAYSELRKRRWQDVSLDQLVENTGGPAALASADGATTERDELIATLYDIINRKLTDRQRDALLAELAGMPLEEIARRTGSTRNALYKLTHDARRRLKLELERRGFTNDDW